MYIEYQSLAKDELHAYELVDNTLSINRLENVWSLYVPLFPYWPVV